jgi:hypothetical protein
VVIVRVSRPSQSEYCFIGLLAAMAKEMRNLTSWIEVAPALLIISMTKVPISPVLETITEEEAEEYDDDS